MARIAEDHFVRVAYFAASALGKRGGQGGYRPYGVLAPIVWLLYHTHALSNNDNIDRAYINLHSKFMSALTGRAGTRGLAMAWGVLLTLLLVPLVFINLFGLLPVLLCGGVQALAIVIIYVCLYFALYRERFKR